MQNWIKTVYPMFKKFFDDKKAVESIEKDLVENIIPEDENQPRIVISTTELKIHVSYDPAVDDIKMFADYIMDLDEMQHAFYFLYTYEVSRRKFVKGVIDEYYKIKHRFEEIGEDIKKLSEESTEQEKYNVELKERYLKQMIVGIYVKSLVPVCYFCDKTFNNRCKFEDVNDFRNLFHFCFIKASRPLDDEECYCYGWEVPGGHREQGEDILETAKRELYEETGAINFEINPICIYSVTAPDNFDGKETFGKLFFAEIHTFEKDLHSEIEKIAIVNELPLNWTYPEIQPRLLEEARQRGFLPKKDEIK